jgi:hypothetical protein
MLIWVHKHAHCRHKRSSASDADFGRSTRLALAVTRYARVDPSVWVPQVHYLNPWCDHKGFGATPHLYSHIQIIAWSDNEKGTVDLHSVCLSFYDISACFFPCFFLSCKANARVKPRKDGARPALILIFVFFYVLFVFVSFSVLFVVICVLYYCHRVATQLQLNISYNNNKNNIFINCNWVVARWQYTFTHKQCTEQHI